MREFYVNISLLYVFSQETLEETEIEGKSEGQKEVEQLGLGAFSSNKVSQLVAEYAERGDEWMRSGSTHSGGGVGVAGVRNMSTGGESVGSGSGRNTTASEIEERQLRMQMNNK